MIGFFDSGLGGLTVLKEVEKLLPQYSYIYLSDNARTPYGSRDQETIYKFTVEGVGKLFEMGARLVIIACNTSSSAALRRIQQEWLPLQRKQNTNFFANRNVLGIIIPTAEEIAKNNGRANVGVLATEATISSDVYAKEINKLNPNIEVYNQACPEFVSLIEAGESEWKKLDHFIEKYTKALLAQTPQLDCVILGCTHYALIEDKIKKYLPENIQIISQGPIIAQKLKDYLARHPEIESLLLKGKENTQFFTTENSPRVEKLVRYFYGEPVKVKVL